MEMFYKSPGEHRGPNGKTFSYVSAERCPQGYFDTLPEAIAGKKTPTKAQKEHVKATKEIFDK